MAKILTVDDSASMRQMIAATLAGEGHSVADASNGSHAFHKAKLEKFDLIITDFVMPDLDGIGLIKLLRGEVEYKTTPILVLTTESSMEFKSKGKAAGATGWILKPLHPEQLLAAVKKVLG